MKTQILAIAMLLLSVTIIKADNSKSEIKIFSKKDVIKLADVYVNNNVNVKNPAIVDVDGDGNFDILNFTKKGNVEYYKNTGTLEAPVFVLENKNFDKYEVHSFLPNGFPVPVFFADRDGDNDKDVFGIVKENKKYDVVYIENTMDLDQYTLITVILVLIIVLIVVLIVR